MSGMEHIKNKVENAFISGEPGTTGREPFEDSSASGPGTKFASSGGAGGLSGSGGPGSGVGNEFGLAGNHANTGTHGLTGDHHNHHHSTTGATGTGTGTGTGAARAVDALTAGSGHDHSHSHSHGQGMGHDQQHGLSTEYGAGKHGTGEPALGGGGLTGAKVAPGVGHRDHGDRVGNVGQDSSKYEGDLHSGPRTSGAAGTDRFDSDRTGVAGGVGSGLDRQHDDGVHHDTSQRAPGEKSGGLSGLLATSDKDFTGRERQGKGAYADTDGPYAENKTGPAGNTALTGREGDLSNNPVAQAKSNDPNHPHTAAGTTGTTGTTATGEHGEHGEHKGFIQKVKDALS